MPKEKQMENAEIGLRIGAGDDITGLLLQQIIETKKNISIKGINPMEGETILQDFSFKDC